MSEWLEVGADNYVLVTEGSLLNTGLVVGSERAMVIDTGCGPRQGREILDAVRENRPPRASGPSVLPAMQILQQVQDEWDARHGARSIPGRPLPKE